MNGPKLQNEPIVEEPQEIVLRRSQSEKRHVISNNYGVYLQESEVYLGIDDDQVSFSQAINSNNANKWLGCLER